MAKEPLQLADNVLLALAGGNALGAYQAGAYEALHERGIEPQWIAGASIGSINGAIIASNEPHCRVQRLRDFWRLAEQFGKPDPSLRPERQGTSLEKQMAALQAFLGGRPGLFSPRPAALLSALPGMREQVSLFDTSPLLATLNELVDFEQLTSGNVRLTATAIDAETGDDVFFDTAHSRVEAEHLRASAAFPAAYPPVEIDGRVLVDPGLSANLPLRAALCEPPQVDTLCLALDLLPLGGKRPRSLGDAVQRAQDLVFASQSRRAIQTLQTEYRLRAQAKAPAPRRSGKGSAAANPDHGRGHVALLHIVYSDDEHETAGKIFDYSEVSIRNRWAAGYRDMQRGLEHFRSLGASGERSVFAAHRFERGALTSYD